jgi:bacterioferritin
LGAAIPEERMATQALIDGLNQQLNREITTFLRYMAQAASISGFAHEGVRQMYLEEVTDEVGHAQYLMNQIVMLGGVPRPEIRFAPPPADVREMLRADAAEEATDVKNYVRLAALAEQEGIYSLKLKMEEQAGDEDEHGREMRRLLG